jgi:hypothetical protein
MPTLHEFSITDVQLLMNCLSALIFNFIDDDEEYKLPLVFSFFARFTCFSA